MKKITNFFGRSSFRVLKIKIVIKDFWVLGFRVARRRHKVARVLVLGFRVVRGTNSLSKFKSNLIIFVLKNVNFVSKTFFSFQNKTFCTKNVQKLEFRNVNKNFETKNVNFACKKQNFAPKIQNSFQKNKNFALRIQNPGPKISTNKKIV